MPLSVEEKQLLVETDEKISAMLTEHCRDDELLISTLEKLPRIQALLTTAEPKELDLYLNSYPGFHYLIKLLHRAEQQTVSEGLC